MPQEILQWALPQEILQWALPLAVELDERPKRPLGRRGCAGRRPSHSGHQSKKYELLKGQKWHLLVL
jgi:hypothetical protein